MDKEHIDFLKGQPFFSHCTDETIQSLLSSMTAETFHPQDIIVKEGEIVDSVFFIISGNAEVTKESADNETLAVLHDNDAIGVNDRFFYSTTGLRTATVKALTDLTALKLSLDDLNIFLAQNPELKESTEFLLRLNFIKKLEPFARISPVKMREIAEKMKEVPMTKGDTLFRQGDIANYCYFIRTGKVDIILEENESEKVLATLGTYDIFGEIGVLTKARRNATAHVAESGSLFMLNQEDLLQYFAEEKEAFTKITERMIHRDRPKKIESVTTHARPLSDGEMSYILKNEALGSYFKLSEDSLYVWNLLDGKRTLQDIGNIYCRKYQVIAIEEIANLVIQLANSGFVESDVVRTYLESREAPMWVNTLLTIRKIMEYEFAVKNTDRFVTKLYNRIGFIFYTPLSHIIMALVAIGGFIAFASFAPHVATILQHTPHSWALLMYQIPLGFIVVPLHELAHALTTKSYGYQVHRFGVGWYWFGPMAFTDTSDMWLANRRQRIAVNMAGIYLNCIVAGIAALLAIMTSNSYLAAFLWLFAVSNYMDAYVNLSPIIELDGYYALMDAFDSPDLRTDSVTLLAFNFFTSIKEKGFFRKHLKELIYWISCITFIVINSVLVYFFQKYVLFNIFPGRASQLLHSHFNWVAPALLIIFSVLSIVASIKQERHQEMS